MVAQTQLAMMASEQMSTFVCVICTRPPSVPLLFVPQESHGQAGLVNQQCWRKALCKMAHSEEKLSGCDHNPTKMFAL